MARIKVELPPNFPYATEIPVRIGDINYGGHLGNDAVLSIIHEARVRFLKQYGYKELDIEGKSTIMADVAIAYKAEAFYGDILQVEVAVCDVHTAGCDFVFRLTNKETGTEVARAKTGIVFYDYEKKKTMTVPEKFKSLFVR